jgi:hypothetical protein
MRSIVLKPQHAWFPKPFAISMYVIEMPFAAFIFRLDFQQIENANFQIIGAYRLKRLCHSVKKFPK